MLQRPNQGFSGRGGDSPDIWESLWLVVKALAALLCFIVIISGSIWLTIKWFQYLF